MPPKKKAAPKKKRATKKAAFEKKLNGQVKCPSCLHQTHRDLLGKIKGTGAKRTGVCPGCDQRFRIPQR
jgi:transcription elongation factor Elf1